MHIECIQEELIRRQRVVPMQGADHSGDAGTVVEGNAEQILARHRRHSLLLLEQIQIDDALVRSLRHLQVPRVTGVEMGVDKHIQHARQAIQQAAEAGILAMEVIHQPIHVLPQAVTDRDLGDARSPLLQIGFIGVDLFR